MGFVSVAEFVFKNKASELKNCKIIYVNCKKIHITYFSGSIY